MQSHSFMAFTWSPYIHWNIGPHSADYENSVSNFINNVSASKLKNAYRSRIKSIYRDLGIRDREANNFLKFANTAAGQNLQSIITNAFNGISIKNPSDFGIKSDNKSGFATASNFTISKNQIQHISQDMVKYLNYLEKYLNKIELFFNQSKSAEYMDLVKKQLKLSSTTFSPQLKNYFLTKNNFNQLNKTHKQLVQNLMAKSNEIKAAKGSKAGWLSRYIREEQTGESLSAFLYKIITPITVLPGLMFEIMATDLIQVNILQPLMNLNIENNLVAIKAQNEGGKSSYTPYSFKIGTKDISITYNGTGKYGKAVFSIPGGISLKKSSQSTKSLFKNIKVKDSNFHKLITLTRTNLSSIMSRQNYIAIMNILANHGVKKKKYGTYNYNKMPELLNALKKSFMVVGLAGSLSAEDFSTIFVVNDNVYNIQDILFALDSNSNSAIVANPSMQTGQKQYANKHKYISGVSRNKTGALTTYHSQSGGQQAQYALIRSNKMMIANAIKWNLKLSMNNFKI